MRAQPPRLFEVGAPWYTFLRALLAFGLFLGVVLGLAAFSPSNSPNLRGLSWACWARPPRRGSCAPRRSGGTSSTRGD